MKSFDETGTRSIACPAAENVARVRAPWRKRLVRSGFIPVRCRHACTQAHAGPRFSVNRLDVGQVVGAIHRGLAGRTAGRSGPDPLSAGSCTRPVIRRACGHALAVRHPRFRSVQFCLCMDLPLACLAVGVSGGARHLAGGGFCSLVLARLANVGARRCAGGHAVRTVVSAAQRRRCSRRAADAHRSHRVACWRGWRSRYW